MTAVPRWAVPIRCCTEFVGWIVTQPESFCYHPSTHVRQSGFPQHIVVGLDGSTDSRRALAWAAALAETREGTVIHLLEALGLPPIPSQPWLAAATKIVEQAETAAHAQLEIEARQLESAGIRTEIHIRRWLPAESLLELAEKVGAGLLAVGRRGQSLRQLLLGSVSGTVSREAKVPVAVVRGEHSSSIPRRILLALDGSPASRIAAEAAAAWFPEAEIVAASARRGDEGLSVAAISEELSAAGCAPERVRRHALTGDPAASLLDLAQREKVDLICAGRRGQGPLHALFVGSVAEKLLQLAPCPLLLAH